MYISTLLSFFKEKSPSMKTVSNALNSRLNLTVLVVTQFTYILLKAPYLDLDWNEYCTEEP